IFFSSVLPPWLLLLLGSFGSAMAAPRLRRLLGRWLRRGSGVLSLPVSSRPAPWLRLVLRLVRPGRSLGHRRAGAGSCRTHLISCQRSCQPRVLLQESALWR